MINMIRQILVIGTLDTKGTEILFLKEQIERRGHKTVVMDIGTRGGHGLHADIPREEVVRTSEMSIQVALDAGDRQQAVDIMIKGARLKAMEMFLSGGLGGIVALGGGTALFMGTAIMQAIPIGVPKLVLSSMVASDIGRFVGGKDITLMQSVADIVGINPITLPILKSAAGAICGMVEAVADKNNISDSHGLLKDKRLIAVTDFGITTPCAMHAARILREKGYEAVIFHTVGSGGTAMEELLNRDLFVGVLDLTTHEFMDHLAGGLCGNIGPERLETAGRRGIPLVVGPGGLDSIVITQEEIPARFKGRRLYYYDFRRCYRPNKQELKEAARIMAERLNRARGPAKVLLPLKGWSEADKEGTPLYDPEGNRVFGKELKRLLNPKIQVIELDVHLNEPIYAETAVTLLDRMIE